MQPMVDRASLAAKIALENRAELNRLAERIESVLSLPVPQNGIDGKNGLNGVDGKDGKDGHSVTDEQFKSFARDWLTENIKQPKDGMNGLDGKSGRDPTAAEIQLAVDLWFAENRLSIRGADGKDGVDGKKGEKGDKGQTGDAPDHEWKGTMLRFKKPSGIWGTWVDLKGDAGASGGGGGGGGGGGTGPRGPAGPQGPAGPAGSSVEYVTLDGVPQVLSFTSVGDGEVEMELIPI